jgi:hypothetical protein
MPLVLLRKAEGLFRPCAQRHRRGNGPEVLTRRAGHCTDTSVASENARGKQREPRRTQEKGRGRIGNGTRALGASPALSQQAAAPWLAALLVCVVCQAARTGNSLHLPRFWAGGTPDTMHSTSLPWRLVGCPTRRKTASSLTHRRACCVGVRTTQQPPQKQV